MTFQIRTSDLPCSAEEFAARVSAHVDRMNEYALHLIGVKADAINPDLTPDHRRVAFPAPNEHSLVESAIREFGAGYVADYEIVGPSLAEKKAALSASVRQREGELIDGVWPVAKRRHWQFREQDIRSADHMRISNHPERIEPDQVDAFLRSARPSGDTAFLEEMKSRHEFVAAIQRWAAKAEHDIDDLTEANVDAFEVTPFHG